MSAIQGDKIMSAQAKKPDISEELNAPDLGERISLALYKEGQVLTLNIEQVSTYDKNPRIHENAEYDSIYESIKANGLEDSLSVSQRPGDDHLRFFLIRGGNTRLTILKALYEETGDKKYYEFSARFKNWESDSVAVIGHLRENDARGDYIFIDRALGIRQAKIELQAETGEALSDRGLIKALSNHGYKVSRADLMRMNYAVDVLHPILPKLLATGLGPRHIDTIKKLDKKAGDLFQEMFPDSEPKDWKSNFSKALAQQEKNHISDDEPFSYQGLYDGILDTLSENNHLNANRLAFLLDERLNGNKKAQPFNPEILKDPEVEKEVSPTFNTSIDTSLSDVSVSDIHPEDQSNKDNLINPPPIQNKSKEVATTPPFNSDNDVDDVNSQETTDQTESHNDTVILEPTITKKSQYIYDDPSQHLVHSNWMYPEEANHNFSIFQDMPLTCEDRIEAAPLPDKAEELREILFYKAFFFKHYMQVPSRVEKIDSGAGFALNKIPDDSGMKLIFDNPKDNKTRTGKTTKHYIGWWILLGFSDLLHQSLSGNFNIIKQYQPEGNLKDYLLTPKENRLDTIDLVYNQQMAFGYLSDLAPLFTSYASPKELQLFIEMMLIHNRLMRVTNHEIWGDTHEQ